MSLARSHWHSPLWCPGSEGAPVLMCQRVWGAPLIWEGPFCSPLGFVGSVGPDKSCYVPALQVLVSSLNKG